MTPDIWFFYATVLGSLHSVVIANFGIMINGECFVLEEGMYPDFYDFNNLSLYLQFPGSFSHSLLFHSCILYLSLEYTGQVTVLRCTHHV